MSAAAQQYPGLPAEVVQKLVELERIKQAQAARNRVTFEVGKKQGIVIRGMGGMYGCVNLSKDQALKLLDHGDELRAFIAQNDHLLK
jgi:hypothetical protein